MMSMVEIVQRDNPILRQIAKDVPISDIPSKKIQNIITDMKEAIAGQDDAVAIAAPQIGESLRIFVVSGKVFMENYPDIEPSENIPDDLVCINPKIIKVSKEKKSVAEGCLSVRWLYGNVKRATRATIEAYDEHGKKFIRGGSGLLAQVFQHEIDHLNGILFTDIAEDIENIPPEKQEQSSKKKNKELHAE